MSDNTSSSGGGVGFTGLLTILFIGLKLTGYIDWSWWWVLSPLWIGLALAVVILGVGYLIYLAVDRHEKRARKARLRNYQRHNWR